MDNSKAVRHFDCLARADLLQPNTTTPAKTAENSARETLFNQGSTEAQITTQIVVVEKKRKKKKEKGIRYEIERGIDCLYSVSRMETVGKKKKIFSCMVTRRVFPNAVMVVCYHHLSQKALQDT